MNLLLQTYITKIQEQYEISSSMFSNFMQCGGWNPKCKQIKLKKQSDWNSCAKIKDHKQNWLCTSNALINYHKACISILQSDAVKYCNSNKDPKECNTQRMKAIKEHQYEIKKVIAARKINIGETLK